MRRVFQDRFAELNHVYCPRRVELLDKDSMLKRYWIIVLGGLLVLITLLFLRPGEEDRILEQLEQIRTLAEVNAPESGIEQIAKAKQIGRMFDEQTFYDLTHAGYGMTEIGNRQDLVQRIIRGRTRLSSLELTLLQPQVHIEGDNAQVQVQASALGSIRGEPGQFLEIHLIEVLLRKEEGAWLVTGARQLRDERKQSQALRDQPG